MQLLGDKSQPRDRHSHQQETMKGQVGTLEKASLEERDRFLSALLETDTDRGVPRRSVSATANIGATGCELQRLSPLISV